MQKSTLLGKYAAKASQAVMAHASEELEQDNMMGLPPKINEGVAELRLCKFGTYKSGPYVGETYFMAQGIVLRPKYAMSYDGRGNETGMIVVEGRRTQLGPEPCCDTLDRVGDKARRTSADHLRWIQDQLKSLWGPGWEDNAERFYLENLEDTAAQLEKTRPTFAFRTWAGTRRDIIQDPDSSTPRFILVEWRNGSQVPVKDRNGNIPGWPSEEAAKQIHKYAGRDPLVNHTWMGYCEFIPLEKNNGQVGQPSQPSQVAAVNDGTANGAARVVGREGLREELQQVEQRQQVQSQPTEPAQFNEFEDHSQPVATAERTQTQRSEAPPQEQPELKDLDEALAEAQQKDNGLVELLDTLVEVSSVRGPSTAKAQNQLAQIAVRYGLTQEQVDDASTWSQLAELILEAQPVTSSKEAEEHQEELTPSPEQHTIEPRQEEAPRWEPKMGEIYPYSQLDPKGTGRKLKPVQCEVVGVNSSDRYVNLKNLVTNQLIMNPETKKSLQVSWDDLEKGE